MGPVNTRAILLRTHDYGDTSRILRFHTREIGLLSVVARGVRTRVGRGRDSATLFASGDLVAFVKAGRDLHTMREFATVRWRGAIGRNLTSFAGAAAFAELLLAHSDTERNEPLFELSEDVLDRLDESGPSQAPGAALSGLWRLVAAFGFAPRLDECVSCGCSPGNLLGRLDLTSGGIVCGDCSTGSTGLRLGPVARTQIKGLLSADALDDIDHPRGHLAVVTAFIDHHLTARRLDSLDFLAKVMPRTAKEGT